MVGAEVMYIHAEDNEHFWDFRKFRLHSAAMSRSHRPHPIIHKREKLCLTIDIAPWSPRKRGISLFVRPMPAEPSQNKKRKARKQRNKNRRGGEQNVIGRGWRPRKRRTPYQFICQLTNKTTAKQRIPWKSRLLIDSSARFFLGHGTSHLITPLANSNKYSLLRIASCQCERDSRRTTGNRISRSLAIESADRNPGYPIPTSENPPSSNYYAWVKLL